MTLVKLDATATSSNQAVSSHTRTYSCTNQKVYSLLRDHEILVASVAYAWLSLSLFGSYFLWGKK